MVCLLYIDENEIQRENFYLDANESVDAGTKEKHFSKIIIEPPVGDLEGMVSKLLEIEFDALVSDYKLSEDKAVEYSGDDLINAFQKYRKDFPCFIRTSYEADAIGDAHDVNMVYSKDDEEHNHSDKHLFERIVAQVKNYRRQADENSQEHADLAQKAAEKGLDARESERFLELDEWLEKAARGDASIPRDAKKLITSPFDQLVEKTNALISKIEKEIDAK